MTKKIFAVLMAVILAFACTLVVLADSNETEILPGREFPHGDVNLDTRVSIKDVTLIRKYLASLSELFDQQLKLADVDGAEGVNVKDATFMQKFIADLVPELLAPIQTSDTSTCVTEITTIPIVATTAENITTEAVTDPTETQPEDTTVVTDPTETQPEDTTVVTDPTETQPEDTTVVTDPTETQPEDTTVVTDPTETQPEDTTAATEATAPTRDPDKPIELPFVPAH